MLPRRIVRTAQAILAALPVLAAARIGRAADPRGDASAHYARGLELGAQNGYDRALREFNQAYAISPQFAVLYNIGQAHIALGHTSEAIEALARYLRDGGDRVPPSRRHQVQVQIAVLRSRLPNPNLPPEAEAARAAGAAAGAAVGQAIAAATDAAHLPAVRPGMLSVRCAEPGLKLLLDGKRIDPVTSASGIPISVGVHRLAFSGPGRRAAEQSLEVPAGVATVVVCANVMPAPTADRSRLFLDGPPVDSAPVFSGVPPDAPPPIVHRSTVGYLLGGLGVALGGTAVGLYLWNRGQYQDAQAEKEALPMIMLDGPPSHYYDVAVQYNEQVDAIRRDNTITIGMAVASVGLIAGGLYLLRTDRKQGDKTAQLDGRRSWAAVSPGGIFWSGIW
jgi:tetratricopeptide (TPR) repeat protein